MKEVVASSSGCGHSFLVRTHEGVVFFRLVVRGKEGAGCSCAVKMHASGGNKHNQAPIYGLLLYSHPHHHVALLA